MALAAVAEPEPEWVNAKEAQDLSGRHRKTLHRLVDAGRIRRRKDGSGRYEYRRADLLRLGDEEVADDHQDELFDSLKQIIQLMRGPMEIYTDHLKDELTQLRARCRYLEDTHVETVRAREAAESTALEREAQVTTLEAQENRKSLALAKGFQVLDALLSEARASKLLGSLDTEQLDGLLELGPAILKPEQLAVLNQLKEHRAKKEAAAAQTQEAAS